MGILTIAESGAKATSVFHTFTDGEPELIPTGLPVDQAIGGLFAGSAGILAAGTGVGKSSTLLHASLNAQLIVPVGVISLEDTPDVFGSRALAIKSGVDSLAIRTKRLTEEQKRRLREAQEELRGVRIHVAYEIGQGIESICHSIKVLAEEHGCELIYVDYLQKIRGDGRDRRNEVGGGFSKLQGACASNNAALMAISQFSRQDTSKPPQLWWLKESGDLENEARLIILMHRDDHNVLHARVAKSTFGGEGLTFHMKRDEQGTLREIEDDDDDL